jgi:hypothetical protein
VIRLAPKKVTAIRVGRLQLSMPGAGCCEITFDTIVIRGMIICGVLL